MQDLFINRINHLAEFGISEKTAKALSSPNNEDTYIAFKNIDSDNPELYIYEQIGFDWMTGEGVSASAFKDQLNDLEGKDLTVHINSPGGDVFDGIAIFNQLLAYDGYVHVIIDGIAASSASIIAMAGDRISMAETSQIMVHDAWTMAVGNEQAMREVADVLAKIDEQIAGVYASRTGRRSSTWRDIMNKDTYYNPDEAVEAKLADEVIRNAKRRKKKREYENVIEDQPIKANNRKVDQISIKLKAIRL